MFKQRKFKVGDRVKIMSGVNAGYEGIIEHVRECLIPNTDDAYPYDVNIIKKRNDHGVVCAEYELKFADNGLKRAVRRLHDKREKI